MSLRTSGERTKTLFLALLVPMVALVAVLLTRPHWDAAPTSLRRAGGANVVEIRNFSFVPSPARVAAGARVTVTNADSTTHTLSSQTAGLFDTGDLAGGTRSVILAPSKPGRYQIYCKIHNYMTGTIEVTGR